MLFDKGSGTTVPPSAWQSVACASVLLLFAVGTLWFSLQEKKQANRAASRIHGSLRAYRLALSGTYSKHG